MNILEKIFPQATLQRKSAVMAHHQLDAMASFYDAGGYEKNSMKSFVAPTQTQPTVEMRGESRTVSDRAWDLSRNDAVVTAIKNTLARGVVGSGLKVFPRPVADIIGISPEEADTFSKRAGFLFDAWASSMYSDASGQFNYYDVVNKMFVNGIIGGNGFGVLQYKQNRNAISGLRVQGIDPYRVQTPSTMFQDPYVADGIKVSKSNVPISIFIKQYDGVNRLSTVSTTGKDYKEVPIHGRYKRNVLHYFRSDRFNQFKGMSAFTPLIDGFKQVSRYTEAELMGAVISSYFTAFITNPTGNLGKGMNLPTPNSTATDYKLGPGLVTGLAPNEDVRIVSRDNANASYEGFYNTQVTTLTAALGLPRDVVMCQFNKSYSASKAALNQAEQLYEQYREDLNRDINNPVYEAFITEQVAKGNLDAPGYLTDPVKKAAYLNCLWVGQSMGSIDPTKDAEAAKLLADEGLQTRRQLALKMFGSSYMDNVKSLGEEKKAREEAGVQTTSEMSALKQAEEDDKNDDKKNGKEDSDE